MAYYRCCGGSNFGKLYYNGTTITDSYNTAITSCSQRATTTNQHPAAVSNSGSKTLQLYTSKNGIDGIILTSITLQMTASCRFNSTGSSGSASSSLTIKAADGTVIYSRTKSTSSNNYPDGTYQETFTVNLQGKSELLAGNYITITASSNANAALRDGGGDPNTNWTNSSASVTLISTTYLGKSSS